MNEFNENNYNRNDTGIEENNSYNAYNNVPYTYQYTPVQKIAKPMTGKKLAALALCFSLLGGALGTGGSMAFMRYASANNSEQAAETADGGNPNSVIRTVDSKNGSVSVTETKVERNGLMTASEVYEKNVNSTVGITTEITTNYFGYQSTAAASGSGFIVTADGYIVTNYHVIDGANKIKVTTYDNKSYDAELVGTDESNDIAVLKIDEDGLTPVTLGSSEELKVGDDVVAIGNPLGELTFTLTSGVVSALDREVTTSNSVMMDLIQTDCAINSGNSGGALFNMYGEVIGVTNAKYSSNSSTEASIDNIGFAIPIDTVKPIVESIIQNGYVSKPYIGVSVDNVSEDLQAYGIPAGALIREVNVDSPAKAAGLKENDIVTQVNGEEVSSSSDLVSAVRKAKIGDELTLKVYRDGKETELTIKVAEKKQETEEKTQEPEQQQMNRGYYGYDGYGSGDMFDFFNNFGY
ncbi:MAG: trypsin-like peptidase domain-containing protein [Ruminococcus sp.]|nr:trypsin-like peptidase domain-containing protein [Ruminococcus sp.]